MKIIRNNKLIIIFIHYELKLVSEAIIGSGDYSLRSQEEGAEGCPFINLYIFI